MSAVTDVSQFISQIAPTLVNQRSNTSEQTTVAPDAISLSNIAFLQAMEQAGSTQDALVKNIMVRAAQAFAPTLAEEHTSGVYNSSTQAQLQNEAMARASGEAASAVLQAQTQGLNAESNIAGNRVNAQRSTTTNKTASPTLGKSAGTIATAAIAAQLAKKGIGKLSDLFTTPAGDASGLPEQLGGGPAVEEALASAAPEQLGGGAAVDAASAALEGTAAGVGADALVGDTAPELLAGEEGASAAAGDAAAGTAIDAAAVDEAGTATALGAGGELAGAGVVGAGIEGSIAGKGGAVSDLSGATPGAVLGSAAAGDDAGAIENLATGGVSGVIQDVGSFLGF